MLKLFKARENIDKERFIYEHITGETFVIVPDQYTLVAEEQALKHLNTGCLFDVEILSMSRLGLRILSEQGMESVRMLDQYGRFMLLTRIIRNHRDELVTFSKSCGKITFTAMVNDFIADFKQQDCTLEELHEMISGDADSLLTSKLTELESIIEDYENSIQGTFTDSEDYISMYIDAIKDSRMLEGKTVWIYGYDSITPKFHHTVFELSRKCETVNFVINESDFGLEKEIQRKFGIAAEAIGDEYRLEKSLVIRDIERSLFADEESPVDYKPDNLTVVRAANPYYEAENAAIYVSHLVRDLGYRMKDIQIIANDEGVMQPIIRRTFGEYGLPVFMDQTRAITDAAVVCFIVGMLKFIEHRRTEDLMVMLKTGFAGIDRDDVSELENYAGRFHIKGSMWDKPFKYGANLIGDDKFDKLQNMRSEIMDKLGKLSASGTVEQFVDSFKTYLETEWNLSETVVENANSQNKMFSFEEAQRSTQSYESAMALLEQMKDIMGSDELDLKEFIEIYMAGLLNVSVGVIPPTKDGLSLGTMIRTRPGDARAVVILGANEGTMPLEPQTEGLFSVDEKNYFRNRGFALGTLDDIKMTEERVAMYRMLSRPSEQLYVSYSMTDADGKDQAPSQIIDALCNLFPKLEIRKDIITEGWNEELISSSKAGMRHLVNHLKDRNTPSKMDTLTQAALSWYENNDADNLKDMLNAAKDENNPAGIGSRIARSLYSRRDGSIVLSASSINSYNDCPFKFFIDKGIKPEEERKFESDPRSIGDVYHECLMTVARKIIDDRNFGKKLLDCDDNELEEIISAELDKISEDYNGGLFISSSTEEYRMDRIKEICAMAVRALALQLVNGSVTDARFEEKFGRGKSFDPLEFEVNGQKVYVEGTFDRVDILNGERVRIVDYKTGPDKFDPWKVEHGYKMQLMIYMMSATSQEYEPAGMFYFNIEDPLQALNDKTTLKEDYFKLNGRYVDEPGVLESMPKEALGGKDPKISREDFDITAQKVSERITEIAEGITNGSVSIRPLKPDQKLVCNFCQFKAICKRDREYVQNQGRMIPPKPKKKEEK